MRVCVCSSGCQKSPSLISLRPHRPLHSSSFAESANVSEKPLDAEREKELQAEEVGTDGSDPASPSWALSSEDSILGISSLPGSFPTVSVGGGWWRARPVLRLRFFFPFFMIDRSGYRDFQASKECISFQRWSEEPRSPWVGRETWRRGCLSPTWDPLIWIGHQSYRF